MDVPVYHAAEPACGAQVIQYRNVILWHRLTKQRSRQMAGDATFDVVSDFDEQELVNALDQTRREVQTRYDLKDTKTEIVQDKDSLTITTASETSLKGVRDVLESKMVKRNLSL